MVTTDQLKYFMEIKKEGNFSRAADNLSISQSSLSKQIMHLEDELGVLLFDRSSKAITVTAEGQEFYEYASEILDIYEEMLNRMEELQSRRERRIILATIPVLSQYKLTLMLSEFSEVYPEIDLTIIEEESAYIIKRLERNEIDLAIIREEDLQQPSTQNHFLAEDELVVIVPEKHRLSHRRALDISDLRCECLVLLVPESGVYQRVIRECRQAGFSPLVKNTNSRIETILGLIDSSELITVLMRKSVIPFLSDKFKMIPLMPVRKSRLILTKPSKAEDSESVTLLEKFILANYC